MSDGIRDVFICEHIDAACDFCGAYPDFLCDAGFMIQGMDGAKSFEPCDAQLCKKHATWNGPDRHLCPDCTEANRGRRGPVKNGKVLAFISASDTKETP